jgi:hypothetical protein
MPDDTAVTVTLQTAPEVVGTAATIAAQSIQTRPATSFPSISARWNPVEGSQDKHFVIDLNGKAVMNLSTGGITVTTGEGEAAKAVWEFISGYCQAALLSMADQKHRDLANAYLAAEKKINHMEDEMKVVKDELAAKKKLISTVRFMDIE